MNETYNIDVLFDYLVQTTVSYSTQRTLSISFYKVKAGKISKIELPEQKKGKF